MIQPIVSHQNMFLPNEGTRIHYLIIALEFIGVSSALDLRQRMSTTLNMSVNTNKATRKYLWGSSYGDKGFVPQSERSHNGRVSLGGGLTIGKQPCISLFGNTQLEWKTCYFFYLWLEVELPLCVDALLVRLVSIFTARIAASRESIMQPWRTALRVGRVICVIS